MTFPVVGDIVTKKIVSIDIDSSVMDAVDKMLEFEHRNIVITDNDKFYILHINNVIEMYLKKYDLTIPLKKLELTPATTMYKRQSVLETMELLNQGIEYICVLDEENKLYGLITYTDITSHIDPDTLMENYRLEDFLKLGRRMKWIDTNEKISKLVEEMLDDSYDNVIVLKDLKPIGILTTKDIMHLIKTKANLDVEVSAHMSQPVESICKKASIKDALAFINKKHYKRVVVVDDKGNLAGVISQKELITMTYSKWATLMKRYQKELKEINEVLKNKNKEFETRASTDSLTGLYNRYKFSQLYLSSYTTMTQRELPMSIILLDIDYFKRVNDSFGHDIGDQVLIQVSHAFLRVLRNEDIVCRWGGEEFIALLPTASLEIAAHLAEKLRRFIEELEIDTVGHITASFGVAEVQIGETMKDVIKRADKALYAAKKLGRNCVKTQEDVE